MSNEREILQCKIITATLDLFDHTHAYAFVVPIPKTSPELFVVAGTKEEICKMLDSKP